MQIDESKQENKKWINKVRLAQYKYLSIYASNEEEQNILKLLKQRLLEDGITEEIINQEVLDYKNLSDEELNKQIKEKVEDLVYRIVNLLAKEGKDEVDSNEYPELYHRIQELMALNPKIANQLINEAFEKENISNGMNCGNALCGGGCSYYFSKKLTYK